MSRFLRIVPERRERWESKKVTIMLPQQFVGELMVSVQVRYARAAALRVVSRAENRSSLWSELSSTRVHRVPRLAAMARGPTTMAVDNAGRPGSIERALLREASTPPSELGDFCATRSRLGGFAVSTDRGFLRCRRIDICASTRW